MHTTATPAPDQRPAFALQSYQPPQLPTGERLEDLEDLHGHTIKCVIDTPDGRLGDQVDIVFVTDTHCWLVLHTEGEYSCDDRPVIDVRRPRPYGLSAKETLHDYLSAEQMHRHGLLSAGQFEALKAIEEQAELAKRMSKAAALRAELAKLEGGAGMSAQANQPKYPAIMQVHTPSGPTYCCASHGRALKGLMAFMGAHTVATSAPPNAECAHCVNEAKNKPAAVTQ